MTEDGIVQSDDEKSLDELKVAARKAASSARKVARDAAGPEAAAHVARHLLAGIPMSDGSTISGFLPIGSEIDVRPALEEALAAGHEVCLPCVIAAGEPLVFRRWRDGDALVKEDFGTQAPSPDAPELKPDILLVPMLAFDEDGYRLGYGGGFYDRSLEALRREKPVLAVGVAYAGQRVAQVPRGPYDQPLDWVITEEGALRFDMETGA